MASLADLFSPTFLMFLGILVLVVALMIVYFESKMRDQNHKIASMLSLVSTLAEDMNGVKMGLNQLAVTRMGGSFPQNFEQPLENSRVLYNQETKLIEVSDGEDDDEEDDDIDEEDDDIDEEDADIDEEDDIDEDDDDDYDDESNHEVKVLKIDMNSQNQYENSLSGNDLELDDLHEELDELDDELSEVKSLSSKSSKLSDKLEETIYGKTIQEPLNISADLKTISINLEDPNSDSLDYKKLSLPKLRSIVSEKGLAPDASKLKKNELLKLLGVE
jgi:hypothetical protein